MTPFLAIVKLTCKSAIRSNIFRLLLFLLVLSVILVPNTIEGDGTAQGFIQLILQYSLGFVACILSVSAIWISCSELCSDVETGQLHMIVVKPVSRITVLFGKYCGVLLIHGVLLLISAIVVYGFVMLQYSRQDFTDEQREKLNTEVFAGRRVYKPKQPDMVVEVQKEIDRRIKEAEINGRPVPKELLDGTQRRWLHDSIRKELMEKRGDVPVEGEIFWEYEGLPESVDDVVYLRFKVFPDTSSPLKEMTTRGKFLGRVMIPQYAPGTSADGEREIKGYIEQIMSTSDHPEEFVTSTYNELMLFGEYLVHKGTAKIGFINYDPTGVNLKFQSVDGPFLLIRESGFFSNYLRAVLVMFLQIAVLALISVSLAAFLSLPTAVFLSISYVLICFFTTYLLQSTYGAYSITMYEGVHMISAGTTKTMEFLLIPLQDFFVTNRLASGELIEMSYILKLLFFSILLRGCPFLLLGAYLYRRRELALTMKQ